MIDVTLEWSSVDRPCETNKTAEDLERLRRFLDEHGTFKFPQLANGLFSAAAGDHAEFAATGYHHVWVRDNVHVAHALWIDGQKDAARRATASLTAHFHRQRFRMRAIIEGRADAGDPMQRPHIRFRGDDLSESPEKWAHAQNDALGAYLWLAAKLTQAGDFQPTSDDWSLFDDFGAYLEAVRYWEDEDSGHWEESRKVSASSIGAVVAGCTQLLELLSNPAARQLIDGERLIRLVARGREALKAILPSECVQSDPAKNRRYDAALLFLIEPFGVATGPLADQIVDDVSRHLTGDYGIRRYLGDSYWCADYKDLLSADRRTADFSDDLGLRDRLLAPGGEAQWCLFDPMLSVIHGRRFVRTGDLAARRLQFHHFARSIRQLTPPGCKFGAYRCPESYYREHGRYVPNDITPLLWTQANLLLALHQARLSFPM